MPSVIDTETGKVMKTFPYTPKGAKDAEAFAAETGGKVVHKEGNPSKPGGKGMAANNSKHLRRSSSTRY